MENTSSKIMSKVFLWMFIGLAVTFVTGRLIANNPEAIEEALGYEIEVVWSKE